MSPDFDYGIRNAIIKSLSLLGAKSDLLSTIGSWGDTLPTEDVIAGIESWNDWKRKELSERLELGRTDNS